MLKQLTKDLIEKFTCEIKQTENFEKIKSNVLDPMIIYTLYRLYPYFIIIIILFIIIVLITVLNFYILLKIYFTRNM